MKKIMLHIRDTNNIGGPNVSNQLIKNSYLNKKYQFEYLKHPMPNGFWSNFLVIPRLVKQIKTFNPDIVHLTGLSRIGFEGIIAARLSGKKALLTIRGSSTDALNFKKKSLYEYIIEPLTMRLAHKVYAVADSMARRPYIKKHTGERLLKTLHNSAPKIELDKIADFELRKRYGIGDETMVIATVGRMIYDKGISFIIEAIKKINRVDIVFVFVGDGPMMSDVENDLSEMLAASKVILLGKQNNVLSILRECDVFLFATLHENLSNALLEACSMELAVVATSVGGNPEVIRNGENGILISPSDSDAIVESINRLADDKNFRESLAIKARQRVMEDFSQEKLLGELDKVYSNL